MEIGNVSLISGILLALPGVLFVYFRSRFLTGRMPPLKDGLALFSFLSVIFHSVGLLIFSGEYLQYFEEPTDNRKLISFSIIVPTVLGILSGLNIKIGWIDNLLRKAGFQTIHPIETAWDWYFSNSREAWSIVKLKDGTRWAGVIGVNSFLSSNPAERDLFIEKVYLIDENDVWSENSSSVWIAHNQIQSIESWPKAKETSE